MKFAKKMRRRRGAKRLDLSDFKEALRDGRTWTGLGVIFEPEGEPHYEVVTELGQVVDILVEVKLQPSEREVTCRLGTATGFWTIPAVGTEVVVVIPEGDLDFMPCVTAILSSGEIPDGAAEGVTVISNGQIIMHDGLNVLVEALVKQTGFAVHTHPDALGGTGPPVNAADPLAYTQVLKSK